MIQWHNLTEVTQLDAIREQSHEVPCLIFKHSTRCNISSIAKLRLEDDWAFDDAQLVPFYLDLLEYRPISGQVAEDFAVYHESPQVLLIWQGECVYDASHLDIAIPELTEQLQRLAPTPTA
jgi:bacillithiol system protein YtxJ